MRQGEINYVKSGAEIQKIFTQVGLRPPCDPSFLSRPEIYNYKKFQRAVSRAQEHIRYLNSAHCANTNTFSSLFSPQEAASNDSVFLPESERTVLNNDLAEIYGDLRREDQRKSNKEKKQAEREAEIGFCCF